MNTLVFGRHARLDGLDDDPRPWCGPRTITDDQIESGLVSTLERSPTDATHWSRASMAKESRLSKSTVGRVWKAFGLKPALPVSECVDSVVKLAGVDQGSQDVVVEVAETQGDAAEVFEAAVDGFGGAVGDTDVEVGQDRPAGHVDDTR